MPRPDVRAERTPQIIEAATRVFARAGFAQTRMEDIAREAGLSKAALYLYFDSKEALIDAILQSFFAHGFAELRGLIDSDRPAAASLLAWVGRRMEELREQAAFLSIGLEFHAAAARQPATRQVLQDYYGQYRAGIAALIRRGAARGELADSQADDLALAIISVCEGATLLWMLDAGAFDPVAVTQRAVAALLGVAAT